MIIDEKEFDEKYGQEFKNLYKECQYYVENFEELQKKIDSENQLINTCQIGNLSLPVPKPDRFFYQIIQYKGFVRFPERLKNFILVKHAFKSEKCDFLPTILDIEPNSRCNFRCTMCQLSSWERGKRADDLSFDDFKAFIDKQFGLTEVKLQGMGEPLLHKDFINMIEYLTSRDIWVRTTVNGSLLHWDNNYKRLVDSGINEVQTSFDGATKEVFESIRRQSNFDQVVENLKVFNEYAASQNRLISRMWVLIQEKNKHQLKEFLELAKYMKFKRVTFSVGLGNWGQEKWNENIEDMKVQELATESELFELIDIGKSNQIEITFWNLADKYKKGKINSICNWPFSRAYISCDLKVVPCCMIGNPDVVEFGDARDFSTVWNGDKYKKFRQNHMKGIIPGYCKNCYE